MFQIRKRIEPLKPTSKNAQATTPKQTPASTEPATLAKKNPSEYGKGAT